MKTTIKHLFFCLLAICLLISNCNVYGLETDTKDIANDSTQSIPAYVSDGSGQVRYGNRNDYISYSNGSFVLYLSHSSADTYRQNLKSNYERGLVTNGWTWIGSVLGAVAGVYVTVKTADLNLLISGSASVLSSGITTYGTSLLQKSASQRIAWMNNLSDRIADVLIKCDTNVGIYVSFNANTTTYVVGIQTY